jgi:hypothetical protein
MILKEYKNKRIIITFSIKKVLTWLFVMTVHHKFSSNNKEKSRKFFIFYTKSNSDSKFSCAMIRASIFFYTTNILTKNAEISHRKALEAYLFSFIIPPLVASFKYFYPIKI